MGEHGALPKRAWFQSFETALITQKCTVDTTIPGIRTPDLRFVFSVPLFTGFVFWCAAVSAQGVRTVEPAPRTREAAGHSKILASGALVSDVLAINPFAFEGLEWSDIEALRASGVERYCERMDALPCLIEAPVALAAGTTVTRLELDAVDGGPSFVKANFYRCPIGASACTLLAEISTEGTPGTTQVGVDLAPPESIDNEVFTYLVEVFPGDDGLTRLIGVRLVFDGSESTVLSEVLSLHAYAFEGRAPADRVALRASSVQRYCTGTACTLMAPIELPSGATVTRIELDAFDTGVANIAVEFSRCDATLGDCAGVASVSTSGAPGATQPGIDLVSPETIDNANFTYRAEVSLDAGEDTRLVGLRLFFDMPAALPKSDRLAVNPFAFEGRSETDSEVLDALADERFCNGDACVMLAPVDLPSGTKVVRLELSGLDTSAEAELRATFLRCSEGFSTCSEVAAVATVGIPGAEVEGVNLGAPEVIDNLLSTYIVEVEGGPNAATSLRAVSLSIERALVFSDGFGTGNTSRWSYTVP